MTNCGTYHKNIRRERKLEDKERISKLEEDNADKFKIIQDLLQERTLFEASRATMQDTLQGLV